MIWQLKNFVKSIFCLAVDSLIWLLPNCLFHCLYRSRMLSNVFRTHRSWINYLNHCRHTATIVDAVPSEVHWQENEGFGQLFKFMDECSDDVSSFNLHSDAWERCQFGKGYFLPLEELPKDKLSYRVRKTDVGFHFTADAVSERWIYLVSHPLPRRYAIEFDLIPHVIFEEQLQIAFQFKSLADRARYVLEFNERIYYQKIERAEFLPRLDSVRVSFREHQKLHIRFESVDNVFSLYFDGKLIMSKQERLYRPQGDRVALIFWSGWLGRGNRPMDFEINNFRSYVESAGGVA